MNARTLLVTGALVGAALPQPLLATTVASGSATSEYVISFTNFDPNAYYCFRAFFGINRQTGPLTAGRGTASGSSDLPDPSCTVSQDGWQITVPPRSAEASAGLEFPLERRHHHDSGFFGTQLAGEVPTDNVFVDEPRTVFVTAEGLMSAEGQTDPVEARRGPNEHAGTQVHLGSFAYVWARSSDPEFDSGFYYLWSYAESCRSAVDDGFTDDCSFAFEYPINQSFEFGLQPNYWYSFALVMGEEFIVSAGVNSAPEPGTLALLGLGLAVFGFTRRRTAENGPPSGRSGTRRPLKVAIIPRIKRSENRLAGQRTSSA